MALTILSVTLARATPLEFLCYFGCDLQQPTPFSVNARGKDWSKSHVADPIQSTIPPRSGLPAGGVITPACEMQQEWLSRPRQARRRVKPGSYSADEPRKGRWAPHVEDKVEVSVVLYRLGKLPPPCVSYDANTIQEWVLVVEASVSDIRGLHSHTFQVQLIGKSRLQSMTSLMCVNDTDRGTSTQADEPDTVQGHFHFLLILLLTP